jgi:hypothetical protein
LGLIKIPNNSLRLAFKNLFTVTEHERTGRGGNIFTGSKHGVGQGKNLLQNPFNPSDP